MAHLVDRERVAATLVRLRAAAPRVHCITNTVAQSFTANVLLALGATPSMSVAAEEVPAFVASADALLVNLGTMDRARHDAIGLALEAALEAQVPWVLDPVLVNRSPERLALARELLNRVPRVMRANAEEFAALAEDGESAAEFAVRRLTTVTLTGATDVVSDGRTVLRLANGHQLMARVTAMGCAATAVIAAALAAEHDPVLSSVAGLAIVNVAGEVAAETARGPGSFATGLLDALYALDPATLKRRIRLSGELLPSQPTTNREPKDTLS